MAYFAIALQAYVAVAVQIEALWDAAEAANLGAHALAAVQFLILPPKHSARCGWLAEPDPR